VPVAAVAAVVAVVVVLAGGIFAYRSMNKPATRAASKPRPATAAVAASPATSTAAPTSAAAVTPSTSPAGVRPPTPVKPSASVPAAIPSATAGTAPQSPAAALVAAAMKDAIAKGWVSVNVSYDDPADNLSGFQAGSAGPARGIESMSIDGQSGTEVLIGNILYFKGTAGFLADEVNVSVPDASRLAGRWVSVTSDDPNFSDDSLGMSLTSLLSESSVTGSISELPVSIKHGVRVVGVTGTTTDPDADPGTTGTLWVSTGSHPMPVEYDEISAAIDVSVYFSHWALPVVIAVPAAATSLTTGRST
jgi:hypothetical protein